MNYVIMVVLLSLSCVMANAQIASTAADFIGIKVDKGIITAVEVKNDDQITAEVKKLEEDIPDRTSFCQQQYTQCLAQIAGMQEKLDTIKPYVVIKEVPVEEPAGIEP